MLVLNHGWMHFFLHGCKRKQEIQLEFFYIMSKKNLVHLAFIPLLFNGKFRTRKPEFPVPDPSLPPKWLLTYLYLRVRFWSRISGHLSVSDIYSKEKIHLHTSDVLGISPTSSHTLQQRQFDPWANEQVWKIH